MEGRPQDCGVSLMSHQHTAAMMRATTAGRMKAPLQAEAAGIPKNTTNDIPAVARRPSEPLPNVCEVFHTDILKLLSFWLNQCAIIRPQGGQPIPESHPTTSISTKTIAMLSAGVDGL